MRGYWNIYERLLAVSHSSILSQGIGPIKTSVDHFCRSGYSSFSDTSILQRGPFNILNHKSPCSYLQSMFICTGESDEPATIALRDSFVQKYSVIITDRWRWALAAKQKTFVVSNDIVMLLTLSLYTSSTGDNDFLLHSHQYLGIRLLQKIAANCVDSVTFVPLFLVYIPYLNSINAPIERSDESRILNTEGDRTLAIRVLFENNAGDPTAGDRIAPPKNIGDNTSGHRTRGDKISGEST
ncbi:hypothetical protein PRIPAC_80498 [Pristionchus pacificus]|uniref:Uncharacterized protein n=1 Tax=Pristionchus pacificus TaxID=54126 RepID=A0A2A6C378_PRIPA|nr:hypothetical protein PRIPAC_80498 [Pristionchus pacificus]|eukprot:PDM72483.1 hypothetical protein PRIPAC_38917 [Pristionchus pacificus]